MVRCFHPDNSCTRTSSGRPASGLIALKLGPRTKNYSSRVLLGSERNNGRSAMVAAKFRPRFREKKRKYDKTNCARVLRRNDKDPTRRGGAAR